LKSSGSSDIQKVNVIATKAQGGGILVSMLITSAATAKRIQSTMKLRTANLDKWIRGSGRAIHPITPLDLGLFTVRRAAG
jgi:hypothetical protein